ncbi:MAG: ABC transporter permease [Clostridia bacterium]|nr:ABC transporter permease [Clostridia bacterium]
MFDKFSLSRDDFGKAPEEITEEAADINEDELFEFAEFDEKKSEIIAAPRYSYWKSVWKTFISSKFTVFVAIFVILIVLFSFIYPKFSDYDPMNAKHINDASHKYLRPSLEHIFGTDNIGEEVFDVVWAGARNSLIISLSATAIDMIIGIIVGAIWGFSKKMDKWMIEIYNVIANVPFLLLAMILSYVLGAGFGPLILTMTVTEWIFVAYFIRTQVMIIRDREYNLASKCLGTSSGVMIVKNILPYMISIIMTYISRQVPMLISYEVFLSYMGLGLGTQYASLGRTISSYKSYMMGYPHLFWIPVAVLAIISISLYIVGQKLADAADPRTHR